MKEEGCSQGQKPPDRIVYSALHGKFASQKRFPKVPLKYAGKSFFQRPLRKSRSNNFCRPDTKFWSLPRSPLRLIGYSICCTPESNVDG